MNEFDLYSSDGIVSGMLAGLAGVWITALVLSIFMIVVYWKLFQKAGEPGWASIVPFYNNYVLFKISFGNGWLFLLSLVPIVNVVMAILLPFKLAKAFGKSAGFGLGLFFLSIIFYPMLAFNSDVYVGVE